jgi:hypothetical protein
MSKSERQNTYREYLETNGIKCELDDFGALGFVRIDPQTDEARSFHIHLSDYEPYLNVALPEFARVPSISGAAHVAETLCGAVNMQCSGVKWFIMEDKTMWAASQIFVPSLEVGCQMLEYCIQSIEASFYLVRRVPKTSDILDRLMLDGEIERLSKGT